MGKKRNKKAVIITAIVMFLGILLILTGLFGGRIAGLFTKGFDYKSIDPENPDMNINTNVRVYYYNIDLPDKTLQFLGDLDGDLAALDAIDAEVQQILKRKQNGFLSDDETARLQSLMDQREAIQVKYHLVADTEGALGQIVDGVEAALSRGADGAALAGDDRGLEHLQYLLCGFGA